MITIILWTFGIIWFIVAAPWFLITLLVNEKQTFRHHLFEILCITLWPITWAAAVIQNKRKAKATA